MMRMMKLVLTLALMLGSVGVAWADSIPQVVGAESNANWTRIVYNDSGNSLTSGTVVVWDNDDTEFDRSGYPYVTTTTTADVDWVAGVTTAATCPAASLCEIVVYGPVQTQIANSTDPGVEDTTVSTTTVDGQAGDWDGGANECYLGLLMEERAADTGATDPAEDGVLMWVFVDPGCED